MLRLIDTGKSDGYANMAVDEALAGCFNKESHTILRMYGWAKPSVSIGYFQKMDEIKTQINTDKDVFSFVRRPTGGGAVVHNGNATFSAVFKREAKPIEWYYGVAREAIVNCTQIITDKKPQMNTDKNIYDHLCLYHLCPSVAFCQSNITEYDVVLKGAKLTGFAARRFSGCYLLQGYIDMGYNNLLKTALIKGFETTLGLKSLPDALTEEEKAVSIKLEDKYRSREWNYKR